jgi:hypothetical protein
MDMSHDHTDFGAEIQFLGLFQIFDPQKYFFLLHPNSRSMDISHDHIEFGPQIPFLGTGGLFLPLQSPKVLFFMLLVKFPIDGYITQPC